MSTDGAGADALEAFVLLAKQGKGESLVAVIQQVLKHPSIFVFGELLECPNIQALQGTPHQPYLDLLKLFAYGTYEDYLNNKAASALPELNPAGVKKLQQLSIVSLAAVHETIPYAHLSAELHVQTMRQLEDLVIDTIYQGLVKGQLDQQQQTLTVHNAMGRDLGPNDVAMMISKLDQWQKAAETTQQLLHSAVKFAEKAAESKKNEVATLQLQKEDKMKQIMAASDSSKEGGHGLGPGMGMMGGMLGIMGAGKYKKRKDHQRR
mmetsp:Transcript_24251/g.34215  ORF Transcript_24251/g.34215 Transcript_24251/m.34215 type:complete len:264 (-) Transcript_24251:185-976(-)|eukprot:CAMPEP_0175101102 /NCGR_PEP_ID=MMETSP0086_2-20121207/7564_1 /TAXON_ID=136419 /ORGANISM="Unknown Unknown, Strain D1" /LENGTH=263 /DNA_ID=CAMNT_0016375503 /DNA_START=22 /DNA_END=813 /DNA_ORIENTATION=+